MYKSLFALFFIVFILFSCREENLNVEDGCPQTLDIVSSFSNQAGENYRVYEDGKAYLIDEGNCYFVAQYYDPNFYNETYVSTDSGVFLKVEEGQNIAPYRNETLEFEGLSNVLDLFRTDITQEDRFLNAFTLQSPSTPTVDEYVNLRQCILNGTCDFIDNRFDLTADPLDNTNTVLKLFALAPSASMVTSKTSISTTLSYFEEGDDFWFEAKYLIQDNLPTTLADFESSFFLEGPGPRIIFRGDRLAIENKFNEKRTYSQPEGSAKSFPLNQWVTVKVHLKYEVNNGEIQMWQDGELIIDQSGPTIPLSIWIQDRIELGISATSNECTLYMDDIRFSDQPF